MFELEKEQEAYPPLLPSQALDFCRSMVVVQPPIYGARVQEIVTRAASFFVGKTLSKIRRPAFAALDMIGEWCAPEDLSRLLAGRHFFALSAQDAAALRKMGLSQAVSSPIQVFLKTEDPTDTAELLREGSGGTVDMREVQDQTEGEAVICEGGRVIRARLGWDLG